MSTASPERRRHVVYVTRNTEYHCRGEECVGVRDRESGSWLCDHPALRSRMMGGVRQGSVQPPERGLRLLFSGQQLIVTSKLICSGRPEREDIFSYTSLCSAGVI